MALYKTYEPCEIDAQLIRVDPELGREVLVSDDHVPSITWEPIDEPAQRAMEKLQTKRKLTQQAEFVLNPERIRAKFMAEYYKSLSEGVIDPELSSYELGASKEALQERAVQIASSKARSK
jgi:hypothetical protein